MKRALTTLAFLLSAVPALAQEPERIPFAGGEITITENADYEKVVAFNGKEMARDYVAFLDRITEVGDRPVALILVGPGGNACGANTLILFPDANGDIQSDRTPGDCGTPVASINQYEMFFVPFVRPGEPLSVLRWNPDDGFSTAGELHYKPERGTGWADINPDAMRFPLDFFRNEAFYNKAVAMLGDSLDGYTLGLGTASTTDRSPDGYWITYGCVPHACGSADTFLAVNPDTESVFMAQNGADGDTSYWPPKEEWSETMLAAVSKGP